ncbi:group II intron maturase-specific domain-containing protein [Dolosigranulum savutiense]|uniref:Group II intron maturase-specific domain-containing protein n=1 Tax=Dolosigranulum savutiense TaxID=3110288 RepID=A0AB74TNW0_9LACT
MTVQEVEHHIGEYYPYIRKKLLNGTYQLQPVRRVEIPKGNGKTRKLGIPVARDRVIQMAIKQIIEPIIDKHFSNSSHGFRPGIFVEIVKEINQVTQGWINYFGLGFVKSFVRRTEEWFRRRLRQLILKRWKKCSTKIKMLQKYGLTEDEAKRIAFSRKAYWHLSQTYEVNKAITTKRLHKWGLKSLTTVAESAYARY